MKRIIIVCFIVISSISLAQSTLPVIPFGERKADLFYWDTNWYDRYEHINPNISIYPGILDDYYPYGAADMYMARVCVANTPILVKGIAGVMHLQKKTNSIHTEYLDTTLSGRVPEQFKLYDNNYNLLGEGDVDQFNPSYKMDFRDGNHRDTFNVYEIYFDKAVLVSGRFYVGGTTHNNMIFGYHEDFNTPPWEHMIHTKYPVFYGGNTNSPSSYTILPNPMEVLYKYYSPYQYTHLILDSTYGSAIYDTTIFAIDQFFYFLPFFAIIDTDYNYYNCQQPTGFRMHYTDEDSIVVTWDSNAAEYWKVLVWTDGQEPDSGMRFTVNTNWIELTGLDTSLYYNIKAMSVCDTLEYNTSAWSSVFRFHIPDYIIEPCAVPEGFRVVLASHDSAVFAWQHSEAGLWYLALWKEVSSDTVLIQSLTETVEVVGLDTSVWYTAQLRTVCDTGNISEWTDTVMFYLPNWDTTGTEPIEVSVAEDHNVRILPNPTRGKVTILSSGSIQKVTLVDSEGREMFVRQVDGNTVMLDLSGYASGIYIIRVETESGVSVNRLVKK